MCYHNKLSKTRDEINKRYWTKLKDDQEHKQIHHVSGFSHPKLLVISTEDNEAFTHYNWGLIPFWCKSFDQAKELRIGTLNAKTETVFTLPSFRGSIGKKRCLILSDGFYEWMDVNKKKYPFHITVKSNSIFSMAGIWDSWVNKETGEEIKTVSILTTEANELMAKIHNTKKRMPLILSKEDEKHWLDSDLSKDDIKGFFKPYPSDDMEAHTISKLITSRSENSNVPQVYKKFDYEEFN